MTRSSWFPALALALCIAACVDAPDVDATEQAVVQKCDVLVPRYQANNYAWWWGALGHCKTGPGGITSDKAIFQCAWDQVPKDDQQACLEEDLHQAKNTAEGIKVVAAYNARPTCAELHQKYFANNYNWWWGALGNCKAGPGGLTDPDQIFNCGWRQIPAIDQQDCLRHALWAAPITQQGIQVVAAFNTHQACPQLTVSYQANDYAWWWGALGNCKTGPGGEVDRDKIFACAWNQIPAGDRLPCLEKHLQEAPVTARGIMQVRAANGLLDSVALHRYDEPLEEPEACEGPTDGSLPDQYFAPDMPELFEDGSGGNEGRLRADLRQVARLADPIKCSLPLAAYWFARADLLGSTVGHGPNYWTGTAFADLSVTGRNAFEKFRDEQPKGPYCAAIKNQPMLDECAALLGPPVPEDALISGCEQALDRAYRVANYLRTGEAVTVPGPWFDAAGKRTTAAALDHKRKLAERNDLGWIAVSGEDDAPLRPVNVPSTDSPQFEIDVDVPVPLAYVGTDVPYKPMPESVHARYVIAQSRGAGYDAPVLTDAWTLADDFEPKIAPNSDVLFFIHGMDSRAEEAESLTRELFAQAAESSRNLVVITVDLPTSGYTETLDYDVISPLLAIGVPNGNLDFSATGLTPLLDFLETFVVKFGEQLRTELGFDEVKAVMGGSLGGNLSFRLGRHPGITWLKNVVVWSPASVWDSMGEGSDLAVHAGPRRTWFNADDRDPDDPLDLSETRQRRRGEFFRKGWDESIVDLLIPISQPESWTSESFQCRDAMIAGSRLDRWETYDARFLSWRWRLAAEQLLYSHHTTDWVTGLPRFMSNDKPMLLACGDADNVPFNDICQATRRTAHDLTLTPGLALFLDRTGHSLDEERPRYWAGKVAEFLRLP